MDTLGFVSENLMVAERIMQKRGPEIWANIEDDDDFLKRLPNRAQPVVSHEASEVQPPLSAKALGKRKAEPGPSSSDGDIGQHKRPKVRGTSSSGADHLILMFPLCVASPRTCTG